MSEENKTTQVNTEDLLKDENFIAKFSEKIAGLLGNMFKKKEDPPTTPKDGDESKVALSEVQKMKKEFEDQLNEVKNQLIDKEKDFQKFSEKQKKMEDENREEKAELILKEAMMDGVPKVVVDAARPILFADFGDKVVKFSETVDGKKVEAEGTLTDAVRRLFKVYPDKVSFSDITKTELDEKGNEKDKQFEERKKVLMSEGKSEFEAIEQAGLEIYDE